MKRGVVSPNWRNVPSVVSVAGVDPGYASGAVVELDKRPGAAEGWVAWSRRKDGRFRVWSCSGEKTAEDLQEALWSASPGSRDRWSATNAWAIEGTFGPFGHEVAESVGEIRCTLKEPDALEVRPLWVQWAPQWLGVGRPTDDQVAEGVRRAMRRLGREKVVAPWEKIPLKAVRQACFDAAGMALWALGEGPDAG